MPPIAFLNGQFLPIEQARVSIDDRGFQFGDGIYEVIRVYGGIPFRLEEHVMRLERSAQAIGIPMTMGTEDWKGLIREGLEQTQLKESKVYIQITRGVAPREHTFPASSLPTILMTIREFTKVDPALRANGVLAIILPDQRWARCSIKSLNLLPNVLAKQQAKDEGAFEAILVKEGLVTEGTSSNVMAVLNGVIVTPPLSDQLLAGVTREEILTLARKAGIGVEEGPLRKSELFEAQEVFLAGTTIEVIGVTRIDGKVIGEDKVGPVTKQLQYLFEEAVKSDSRY